jgi:hypothetical protein
LNSGTIGLPNSGLIVSGSATGAGCVRGAGRRVILRAGFAALRLVLRFAARLLPLRARFGARFVARFAPPLRPALRAGPLLELPFRFFAMSALPPNVGRS